MTIVNKPPTKEFDENFDRVFRKKDTYPPGGHHNGSMQTTEEEAEVNRKAPPNIVAKFPPDYK